LKALLAGAAVGALAAGCDAGLQHDAPHDVGATIHIVGQNVSSTQSLVPNAPIEIAFDRLLDPSSITRQTFLLQDVGGQPLEPTPSYDPVARVVRLCMTDGPALQADQTYRLTLIAPQSPTDPSGLRAIDGAGLDPSVNPVIEFDVVAGTPPTGSDACSGATLVDFCTNVFPKIFQPAGCGTLANCHGVPPSAAGLLMATPQEIQATAIDRVAQGSNTGMQSQAAPPGILFGVDMPIISPDNPGNSWMMYKLLLAVPSLTTVGDNLYPSVSPAWTVMSDDERATLSNYILGREMPYPTDPSAAPSGSASPTPLTADQLDAVSTWILQGAAIPQAGCTP
jgi:hypothetical protein